jgi:hypothetical protein
MLDFNPGSLTPSIVDLPAVNGEDYRPIAVDTRGDGRTDILWYVRGEGGDHYWDFRPDGRIVPSDLAVDGRYDAAAGDFFGDGHGDVFWFGGTASYIWDWHRGDGSLSRTDWAFGVSG